jgi:hypothetical protein
MDVMDCTQGWLRWPEACDRMSHTSVVVALNVRLLRRVWI